MHNNDPRIVKSTRAIEQLSFDEAAELAYFGAKILHPASIWPAQLYNVPVRLLAYGFLRKVFEVFEKYRTSIDMITTSEVAVSVTIDNDQFLSEISRELEAYGTVEVDKGQTIISIVGNEITETQDIIHHLFESIKHIPVRMISYGGSHHNISLLIPGNYKIETLQLLNKGLFGLD